MNSDLNSDLSQFDRMAIMVAVLDELRETCSGSVDRTVTLDEVMIAVLQTNQPCQSQKGWRVGKNDSLEHVTLLFTTLPACVRTSEHVH